MANTPTRGIRLDAEYLGYIERLKTLWHLADDSAVMKEALKICAEKEGVRNVSKKITATTSTGGKATIEVIDNSIGDGAANLDEIEFAAYRLARLQADPKNGADLSKAKATLEGAGFEVYWN